MGKKAAFMLLIAASFLSVIIVNTLYFSSKNEDSSNTIQLPPILEFKYNLDDSVQRFSKAIQIPTISHSVERVYLFLSRMIFL